MNVEELERAIRSLRDAAPTRASDEALPLLWRRFGELAGLRAVELAFESPLRFAQPQGLSEALQGWGRNSPEEAWEWTLEFRNQAGHQNSNEGRLASNMIASLARSLAEGGNVELLIKEMTETSDGNLQNMLSMVIGSALARSDPEQILLLIDRLRPGRARAAMVGQLASGMAEHDPRGAADWAVSLDADERRGALPSVLNLWRRSGDSEGATQWLLEQRWNPEIGNAVRAHFSGLNAANPADAIRQWEGVQDPVQRDAAALGIISSKLINYPAEAFSFAEHLSDPGQRTAFLRGTFQAWHRKEPEAAMNHLATSSRLTAEERSMLARAPSEPAERITLGSSVSPQP